VKIVGLMAKEGGERSLSEPCRRYHAIIILPDRTLFALPVRLEKSGGIPVLQEAGGLNQDDLDALSPRQIDSVLKRFYRSNKRATATHQGLSLQLQNYTNCSAGPMVQDFMQPIPTYVKEPDWLHQVLGYGEPRTYYSRTDDLFLMSILRQQNPAQFPN
jgi:hypothetical protein